MIIISIYDNKAQTWSNPCVVANRAVATRDFGTLINSPNTQPHQYPGDFDLYEVGEWSVLDGCIKPSVEHLKLANGADYVKQD